MKIECAATGSSHFIEIEDHLDADGDVMLTASEEVYDQRGFYRSIEVFLNGDARRALVKALQALDSE